MNLQVPQIMGVLNVTPDSFSDGNCYLTLDAALARARQMIAEGASIIDVGGESTRPGAFPVPLEIELQRVVPVVQALARETDIVISVDTSKPEVMQAVLENGAGMINDITGFTQPGTLAVMQQSQAYLCVMHMQGVPALYATSACLSRCGT